MTRHQARHPGTRPTTVPPTTARTLSSQDFFMTDHTQPERPHAPADHETGWWDDNGRPAPWPDDFTDPDAGWTTENTAVPADDGDETDPKNQPL